MSRRCTPQWPKLARDDGGRIKQLTAKWLTGSHLRAVAALSLLSLFCFLPGLSTIPPVDRDEARFVQSTKQMLETDNYVDIRFQEGTRYKKPIGIYWLQAASVKLTGYDEEAPVWAYRLASVAGALAAVLLTYWACLPLFGRIAAFIAAAGLTVSPILVVEAHSAKTDAVLLATIVLTQGSLARIYLSKTTGRSSPYAALLFWIGLALGILVKGPIVVMVAGLTILTLVVIERRGKWLLDLRPLIGVPVAAAMVLPWFVSILSIAGKDFIGQSVGRDFLGKVGSGQEGHGAPPGTHFVLFWLIFWPAAALLPAAARWIWRQRNDPSVRFCLAWIIPSFLVFEAVVTKLPHYTLPTYPAIAVLIGGAAVAGGVNTSWISARVPILLTALLIVVLSIGSVVAIERFGGGVAFAASAALVTIAIAFMSLRPALSGRAVVAAAVLAVAIVPLYVLVFGSVVPTLSHRWLTPRLASAIERTARCADRQIASAGYQEASLIFTLGTKVWFVDASGAANFLKEPGCRVALIDTKSENDFLASAAAAGASVQKRETVNGLDIGRFGKMTIGLYMPANSGKQEN